MVNGELIMKKGYKRTEVGVVPVDWVICKINKCTNYVDYRGKTPEKTTKGRFLVTAKNIKKGYIDYEISKEYVAEEEYENIMRRGLPRKGDVLITTEAPLGNVSSVDREDIALAQRVIKYRTIDFVLDNSFFKHYLLSEQFQKILDESSSGSTAKGIKGSVLHKLPVLFPPTLEEQKAIAKVLSDTDNLIQALEKRIAKKRLIKQGAMQKLLAPKDDWEVKKLGEIGECIIGLTYSPDNVRDSGKLVLRSSNIQGSVLRFDNNVFVDVQVPEKLIVKKNDILICVRNGSRDLIGKCALIGGRAVGETFGAFMSVFRSPFNEFVFIVFQSSIIKKQIDEHLGATINQITNKSLNSFEIPFPPKEEQTHIATILSDMDSEIEALEKKLAKYQQLKQGLMQNLLTGKIRLI